MKASLFVVMGIALFLGGCVTVGPSGSFRPDGLPKQEYYVGGGFMIDYRATENGTAIVVEEKSGKLVSTKTLTPAQPTFSFDTDPMDEDVIERLKTIGIDPIDMKFNLYFVPDEQSTEDKD